MISASVKGILRGGGFAPADWFDALPYGSMGSVFRKTPGGTHG